MSSSLQLIIWNRRCITVVNIMSDLEVTNTSGLLFGSLIGTCFIRKVNVSLPGFATFQADLESGCILARRGMGSCILSLTHDLIRHRVSQRIRSSWANQGDAKMLWFHSRANHRYRYHFYTPTLNRNCKDPGVLSCHKIPLILLWTQRICQLQDCRYDHQ